MCGQVVYLDELLYVLEYDEYWEDAGLADLDSWFIICSLVGEPRGVRVGPLEPYSLNRSIGSLISVGWLCIFCRGCSLLVELGSVCRSTIVPW